MQIVWLEDDLKTVRNSVNYIKETLGVRAQLCQNFAEFSDLLEVLEDRPDTVIIIDIRMLFNMEMIFTCFDRKFQVNEELDAGFEYFKECIQKRFHNAKILFFTSKPLDEAKKDAKKYAIDTAMIITKDNFNALLRAIRSHYEK